MGVQAGRSEFIDNQKLCEPVGRLLEAHGDPRHLVKAGFEVFHR